MFDVTASIVLYRNQPDTLLKTIRCFLNVNRNKKLLLIDNSPTDDLRSLISAETCEYIFNNDNTGFGKGHNIAIKKVLEQTPYHLVLNPDVTFEAEVIEKLISYMDQHPETGLVMPLVLGEDGNIQRCARRLPLPTELFIRRLRFNFLTRMFDAELSRHEMTDKDYTKPFDAPALSGCFMFFRTGALRQTGLFDERFFMYLEDIDITRRIHARFRTTCYTDVQIHHGHARESYRWNKLFFIHIQSAIRYFNKWGWIFDSERDRFNAE